MNEIKWIKIDIGLFANRKIKYLRTFSDGDTLVVLWVQLLCLAGSNEDGLICVTPDMPYTLEQLATVCDVSAGQMGDALVMFEKLGMVTISDGFISICNWEKYQATEKMKKIREDTRKRVARYREKKSNAECNADVTDKKKEVRSKKKENIYIPSLNDVIEYCESRNNSVDAKRFYDYYTANDWKDSKGKKVKNWKLKVITWESHNDNKMPDFTLKKKERKLSAEDEEILRRLREG